MFVCCLLTALGGDTEFSSRLASVGRVNPEEVAAVRRVQIVKKPARPRPAPPLDLRTPSGRLLPY